MIGLAVVLQLIAALIVAVRAVIVINRMSRSTRSAYALAWISAGGAAASFVANTLAAQTPADLHTSMLLAAAAVTLILDKRGH